MFEITICKIQPMNAETPDDAAKILAPTMYNVRSGLLGSASLRAVKPLGFKRTREASGVSNSGKPKADGFATAKPVLRRSA